jgi:hypothetical protein
MNGVVDHAPMAVAAGAAPYDVVGRFMWTARGALDWPLLEEASDLPEGAALTFRDLFFADGLEQADLLSLSAESLQDQIALFSRVLKSEGFSRFRHPVAIVLAATLLRTAPLTVEQKPLLAALKKAVAAGPLRQGLLTALTSGLPASAGQDDLMQCHPLLDVDVASLAVDCTPSSVASSPALTGSPASPLLPEADRATISASLAALAALSIAACADVADRETINALLAVAVPLALSDKLPAASVAAAVFRRLFRHAPGREAIYAHPRGGAAVRGVVAKAAEAAGANETPDFVYSSLFTVWLLTFGPFSAPDTRPATVFGPVPDGAVPSLVASTASALVRQMAAPAPREKIVRVAVTALVAASQLPDCLEHVAGLPRLAVALAAVAAHPWGDEDVIEAVQDLEARLALHTKARSSWTHLAIEVSTGSLSFQSPVHRDQLFWTTEARRIEEGSFQVLRDLIKIAEAGLARGADHQSEVAAESAAVALHDIGMVCVHHPRGRAIIMELFPAGKDAIVSGLEYAGAKAGLVQEEALFACERLFVTNYGLLSNK